LPDGTRAPRQKVIGTPERYKNKAAAESAAGGLRLMANDRTNLSLIRFGVPDGI
jgi:hypothetical protein